MMSSVNWVEAKRFYMADSRQSYQKLAITYGVSKSTIQKYATRHGWAKEREQYRDEATKNFMRTRQYDIDDINSQHIKIYRTMQIIGYNLLVRATKEISLGNLKNGASILKCASNVIGHGIKGERKILGLSTRPKKAKTNTQKEKDVTPWLNLFEQFSEKTDNTDKPI